MPEPRYPPAPELYGELILDVFTHPSLRIEGGGSMDNERYTLLGEAVLCASVTHCVFLSHPNYGKGEIEEERARQLTDQNIEDWTKHYRFRDKLRYNASVHDEVISPKGARELFYAYIGGAYTQPNGPMIVNSWVYKLIVPPEDRVKLPEMPTFPYYAVQPPPPSIPYPMPPPPPPSQTRVPTGFPTRSRTNSSVSERNLAMHIDDPFIASALRPTPSHTPGKPMYLPRFNEITTRRRFHVEWPAEQTGLQHAPRWVVKCVVDGTEVGMGSATTKQLAKEEAARQAFDSLAFEFPMP